MTKTMEPEKNKCAKCGKLTLHDLCIRCRTQTRLRYYDVEPHATRTATRIGGADLARDARQSVRRSTTRNASASAYRNHPISTE